MYDYDWGMRDDFMGQASILPSKLKFGESSDLVLTLVEAGEIQYDNFSHICTPFPSILSITCQQHKYFVTYLAMLYHIFLSLSGKSEYLGQLSLEVSLQTLSATSDTLVKEDIFRRLSSGLDLNAAARKLKGETWSAVVSVVLIEGKDLAQKDQERSSDPYCKFS